MDSPPSSTLGDITPAMSASVRAETRVETARSTSSGSAPDSSAVAISVAACPHFRRLSVRSASRAFSIATPATAASAWAISVSAGVKGPPVRFSVR
jgi:hypothetical protein